MTLDARGAHAAVLRPGDLHLGQGARPPPRSRCSRTSASTASRRSPRRSRTRAATSCWRRCSPACSSASSAALAGLRWPSWSGPTGRAIPTSTRPSSHVARTRRRRLALRRSSTRRCSSPTSGSGMGAQLGASRLLYGMGRDDAIPRGFFGALNPRTHVPAQQRAPGRARSRSPALHGCSYGLGAELLNFGALIAFMGVNLSALVHYFVARRAQDRAEPGAAAARLPDLRLPLVEPQPATRRGRAASPGSRPASPTAPGRRRASRSRSSSRKSNSREFPAPPVRCFR